MNQQRLKRCPNGTFRNKSSGLCEPKNNDVVAAGNKRCPNGTYKNKVTGLCEPKLKSPNPVTRIRCPNGTYRNKVTGLCEPKRKSSPLRKSPLRKSPLRKSPLRKSPLRKSPLRSSPLRSSPMRSSPLRSSPMRSSPLRSSPLRSSPLRSSPMRSSPLRSSSRSSSISFSRSSSGSSRRFSITSPSRSSFGSFYLGSPMRSSPGRSSRSSSSSISSSATTIGGRSSSPRRSMDPYRSPVTKRSSKKRRSYLSVLPNKKYARDDNYVLTPKLLNFYKENASPTIQEKDIHPGSNHFSTLAFNYLSRRYDNFSYVKYLGENLTLGFFVINDEPGKFRISVRNSPRQNKEYLIYDFENDMIQRMRDFDELVESIKREVATKKRFITFRINMQEKDAHANVVIYDTKKKTLELFEPHGSKTPDRFHPYKIRYLLQTIFDEISPRIEFLQSFQINPYMGLQTVQCREKLVRPNEILGYCAAWCFFYLQMRIANPDLSQINLIQQIKNEVIKKGNFFNMIRNYVKYIVNSGYRHKHNIKPRKLRFR